MVYMGISYNADHLPGNVWVINAVNGVLDGVSQELVKIAILSSNIENIVRNKIILFLIV